MYQDVCPVTRFAVRPVTRLRKGYLKLLGVQIVLVLQQMGISGLRIYEASWPWPLTFLPHNDNSGYRCHGNLYTECKCSTTFCSWGVNPDGKTAKQRCRPADGMQCLLRLRVWGEPLSNCWSTFSEATSYMRHRGKCSTGLSIVLCLAPRVGALSDDARLTSVWRLTYVCLSRTSGLSREQRGLGRLKLAQR